MLLYNEKKKNKNIFSVSFGKSLRNRGVDQWGHSMNVPTEGTIDYKNWTKIARYSPVLFCFVSLLFHYICLAEFLIIYTIF